MEEPVVHYDRVLGLNPEWRTVVIEALKGNTQPLNDYSGVLLQIAPSAVRALTATFGYARCGQNVYSLGPRMQELLSATPCTKLPQQFFVFPHRTIYVATPGTKWELFGDEHTLMHPLSGFYMTYTPDDHQLMFVLWGKDNERSRCAGDDATFWFEVDTDQVPRTTDAAGTVLLDFETYIKDSLGGLGRDLSDFEIPAQCKDLVLRDIPVVMRTGLNLIFYLNSKQAEIKRDDSLLRSHKAAEYRLKKAARTRSPKKAKKQRRAEKDLAKLSEAVILWIGQDSEQRLEEQEQRVQAGGRKGTWTCRAAHWHHYWTGRRKNEDGSWRTDDQGNRICGDALELRLIQPIYRDMAAIVASRGRQYRFKQERKDYTGRCETGEKV